MADGTIEVSSTAPQQSITFPSSYCPDCGAPAGKGSPTANGSVGWDCGSAKLHDEPEGRRTLECWQREANNLRKWKKDAMQVLNRLDTLQELDPPVAEWGGSLIEGAAVAIKKLREMVKGMVPAPVVERACTLSAQCGNCGPVAEDAPDEDEGVLRRVLAHEAEMDDEDRGWFSSLGGLALAQALHEHEAKKP